MRDDSARFSGSIPEHYDRGLGPVLFDVFAHLMAERTAAMAPSNVLETAAGTGIVTRKLRDRLPASTRLVATDLSSAMLDHARAKFSPEENVVFQAEDATRLSLSDDAFDAVVCQFGIMFFPDREAGYREAFRVLAPEGRYLFSVWDAIDFNPHGRIASEMLVETFNIDPPPFLRVGYGCAAIDPIKASLHAAGFGSIRADVVRKDAPVVDSRAFAFGMVKGNPLAEQIASRGVDPETLVDAVEERMKREFGAAGVPLQAIVFEARKG